MDPLAFTPNSFEQYVSSLFEALDYTISRNDLIMGQQTDFVATKSVDAAGDIVLHVECKFRSTNKVSNQDIYEYLSFLRALPPNRITKGIMVTNNGFSKDAMQAAKESQILQLLDLQQLEKQLFHVTHHYVTFCNKCTDEDPFWNYYTPISGLLLNQSPNQVDDLESNILKSLADFPLTVILGDYGSGKTTLIKRLKFCLAQRYLRNGNGRKPILFSLNERHNYASFSEFLSHTVHHELGHKVSVQLFDRFRRQGEFLLLFDGFDEISKKSTLASRKQYFAELASLVCTESPSYLTCRPTYFVNYEEYIQLLRESSFYPTKLHLQRGSSSRSDHYLESDLRKQLRARFQMPNSKRATFGQEHCRTFVTELFDQRQILLVLTKYEKALEQVNVGPNQLLAFLNAVYDLGDLIKRPLLLHMIVETILAGKIDVANKDLKYGPSTLYEHYVEMQLDIEVVKGQTRTLLERNQRFEFATSMALIMLESGDSSGVVHSDIVRYAQRLFPHKESLDKDFEQALVTDLRVCAFITSEGDSFRFVHLSFMEFFCAWFFLQNARLGILDERLRKRLPVEVLYFLGGFCVTDSSVRLLLIEKLNNLHGKSEHIQTRSNLLGALMFGEGTIKSTWVSNASVSSVSSRSVTFEMSNLSDLSFIQCTYSDVCFVQCDTYGLSLKKLEAGRLLIAGGKADLSLTSCRLNAVCLESTNVKMSIVDLDASQIVIDSSTVRFEGIARAELIIDNSTVFLSETANGSSMSGVLIAKGSTICFDAVNNHDKSGLCRTVVKASWCRLPWLVLSLGALKQSSFTRCRGVVGVNGGNSEDWTVKWENFVAFVNLYKLFEAGALLGVKEFLMEKLTESESDKALAWIAHYYQRWD